MAFTPFEAGIGGAILAATVFFFTYYHGRVLGISGISCGAMLPSATSGPSDRHWRIAFLVGLVFGGFVITKYFVEPFGVFDSTDLLQAIELRKLSVWGYLLAGLLVGVGTQMGSGCTSGHGLVGLSRISPRSFVAVPTFIMAGGLGALFSGRFTFIDTSRPPLSSIPTDTLLSKVYSPVYNQPEVYVGYGTILAVVIAIYLVFKSILPRNNTGIVVSAGFTGLSFGTALALTGMTIPEKVLGFLSFLACLPPFNAIAVADSRLPTSFVPVWDPSLMFVMGVGVLPNIFLYRWLIMHKMYRTQHPPILTPKWELPTARHIDLQLIGGASLFGLGWGIAGYCPGPGFINVATLHSMNEWIWLVGVIVGTISYRKYIAEILRLRSSHHHKHKHHSHKSKSRSRQSTTNDDGVRVDASSTDDVGVSKKE